LRKRSERLTAERPNQEKNHASARNLTVRLITIIIWELVLTVWTSPPAYERNAAVIL